MRKPAIFELNTSTKDPAKQNEQEKVILTIIQYFDEGTEFPVVENRIEELVEKYKGKKYVMLQVYSTF